MREIAMILLVIFVGLGLAEAVRFVRDDLMSSVELDERLERRHALYESRGVRKPFVFSKAEP